QVLIVWQPGRRGAESFQFGNGVKRFPQLLGWSHTNRSRYCAQYSALLICAPVAGELLGRDCQLGCFSGICEVCYMMQSDADIEDCPRVQSDRDKTRIVGGRAQQCRDLKQCNQMVFAEMEDTKWRLCLLS